MNVLIIEDEDLAAKRLTRLLDQLAPEAQILAILDSVKGAVAWLERQQADLIFLDIHLADGNSFAIFDQVSVRTPIIFVTAYDQYALQAFRHNSLDYLLKPVEEAELARALAKFRAARIPPLVDLPALLAAMQPAAAPTYQQRFLVNSGEKIRSIPTPEVAYFFGQQKYVFLITQDGRQHLVDYTLSQLEDLLDPARFFRINRQFIISFEAIAQMYPYSKSRIRVDLHPPSDLEAVVSIEKTPRFKEWLNR